MARTITTTVYEYEELSDAAKEAAREWYRSGNLDYDWWDGVYEDAKSAGAILGIDIEDNHFTGFYLQGSGASFKGTYRYRKGWRKALRAEFGTGLLEKLERIGQRLQDAQRPVFYSALAECSPSGGNWTRVSVEFADEEGGIAEQEVFSRCDHEIAGALRGFAAWIFSSLEAEYEYLQSDDVVAESIIANGYEFTEDGERA